MSYPINHHILAEDFRVHSEGGKSYSQEDAKWLHESLSKMCEAYDAMSDATALVCLGSRGNALLVVTPFDNDKAAIDFFDKVASPAHHGYTLVSITTPDGYVKPQ